MTDDFWNTTKAKNYYSSKLKYSVNLVNYLLPALNSISFCKNGIKNYRNRISCISPPSTYKALISGRTGVFTLIKLYGCCIVWFLCAYAIAVVIYFKYYFYSKNVKKSCLVVYKVLCRYSHNTQIQRWFYLGWFHLWLVVTS